VLRRPLQYRESVLDSPVTRHQVLKRRYGHWMPLNRLAALEANLAIPLADSTQWEEIDRWATQMQPVLDESIRNAA
jgi:hypothetical protein